MRVGAKKLLESKINSMKIIILVNSWGLCAFDVILLLIWLRIYWCVYMSSENRGKDPESELREPREGC